MLPCLNLETSQQGLHIVKIKAINHSDPSAKIWPTRYVFRKKRVSCVFLSLWGSLHRGGYALLRSWDGSQSGRQTKKRFLGWVNMVRIMEKKRCRLTHGKCKMGSTATEAFLCADIFADLQGDGLFSSLFRTRGVFVWRSIRCACIEASADTSKLAGDRLKSHSSHQEWIFFYVARTIRSKEWSRLCEEFEKRTFEEWYGPFPSIFSLRRRFRLFAFWGWNRWEKRQPFPVLRVFVFSIARNGSILPSALQNAYILWDVGVFLFSKVGMEGWFLEKLK